LELLLTGQNNNFEFNKGVNFMNVQKKIKLTALTCEDLKIFSYLCQDGIFSKDELMFDKKEYLFLATFSRYCWEKNKKNTLKDSKINYRVISGMQIKNVKKVDYINFDNVLDINFLNLLLISYKNKKITLHFSSSVKIILIIDKVFGVLEDIDIPWPTKLKPNHK
jgi:hypothetical protein